MAEVAEQAMLGYDSPLVRRAAKEPPQGPPPGPPLQSKGQYQ